MTATLFGVYNAQRALSMNQAVIDLISNNISNMNTPGYSKQRAEIAQQTSGNNSTIPQNACQDVMGAVITDISRNRDAYLDTYYRSENSNFSYFKELSENAQLIEDITNELDNVGINNSLNEFYESLSQLSSNPTDIVARNNVVQKAIELTTKFNSAYNRLEDLRTNLVGDGVSVENTKISATIDDLNNKLSAVADLNDSIVLTTSQGNSPNYLLDKRDQLLDEVSSLIPIKITPESNGSVTLGLNGINLVSGKDQIGFFDAIPNPGAAPAPTNNPAIVQIKNATGGVYVADAYPSLVSGKIGAILEMGGSDANKLTIKSVQDDLTTLAQQLASELNAIQAGGQIIDNTVDPHVLTLDGDPTTPAIDPRPDIFVDDLGTTAGITAGNIRINDAIIDNPYKLAAADAASDPAETGDGGNALKMYQARESLIAGLGGATTEQYITNLAGSIGSKASTIESNLSIKENVSEQIKLKRESVTGVSLDEEMTDLIRFQRAYEASARVFNIVDKNIQTILNMLR